MISVIMPAYNAERFVQRAVESILRQTYTDYELIVVDDGSSDGTLAILQGYEQKGQLKLVRGNHEGVGAAMNLAASHATRPWLAVMHADDEALPHRLERQIEAAQQNPDVVIWGTHAYHINEDEKVLGLSRFGPETRDQFEKIFMSGGHVNVLHPTAMLRRDVFEKVGGYDSRFRCSEDVELYMRMAHHGPALTIPEPLLHYRLHGQSNTMLRFNDQFVELRFLTARRLAEIEGKTLEFDAFLEQHKQHGRIKKLADNVMRAGRFRWRNAAFLMGQRKRHQAMLNLAAAFVCSPCYCTQKLWRSFVSPEALRLMRANRQ